MSKKSSWDHDALASDLAAYLRASQDRVVWTDMQLGPSGSPRPDVYSLPKSYTKFRPLAYEAKVSVADFRRDITSGKWQSYLKYASAVVFAVPAGLINKEDVPVGCGLIVRHEEVWRMAKGPTLRVVDTLPPETWMKLMIDGIDRHNSQASARFLDTYRVQQKIRKSYGDDLASALSNRDIAVNTLITKRNSIQLEIEQAQKHQHDARERARATLIEEVGMVSKSRAEFCKLLQIPESASIYDIQYAARDCGRRLDESEEIKRLQEQIRRIKHAIDQANEPMPSLALNAPFSSEDDL